MITIMRTIVVVIVLFAGAASAADFRTIEFGDPCAPVRDKELALGSTKITWSGISPYVYAFKGQEFGREVQISYFCFPHESLSVGNYFIPEGNLDDAVRSYREVYAELIGKLGAPNLDNTPWQNGRAENNREPVPSDKSKYVVFWMGQRMDTTLSLLRSGDKTTEYWKVAIAVGPNKETREAITK
jgi:hypothetical protein